MVYTKNNKPLSSYHIKCVLETPARIAQYAPNKLQSLVKQTGDHLVTISKHLWAYYCDLDMYLDTGTHNSFNEPNSLLQAEKIILEKIKELPEAYANELLGQHMQFKKIFIKRSLRERDTPGQLNEFTLLNLPLLGVFFGSKGDLLAIPTIIAFKHSSLHQKTISFCSRYMRYFVRVRAVIDDIKDWENDLQYGHLTCIHLQCIKALALIQYDQTEHLCLNLKDSRELIKTTLYQKVVPRLIYEMIRTHREYIKEIDSDEILSDDFKRIKAILEPALSYFENLANKYRLYCERQLPTAINIDASTKICYSI